MNTRGLGSAVLVIIDFRFKITKELVLKSSHFYNKIAKQSNL